MPHKFRIFSFSYLKTSVLQRYRRFLINTLPGKSTHRQFILLSSPRSGSTLLHTYLNSNLNIYSLGELPWRELENGIDTDYFKPYPNVIQAIGFKVFYQFSEQAPYDDLYSKLTQDKDLKVIHLTRENMLEKYISEVLAWQKREWTTKKETSNEDKITLDLAAFEAHVHQQKAQQAQSLEDFKEHSMISLSYESLTQDPETVLNEVQSFLGVRIRKLFTVLEKQATYSLSDLLKNVDEVREKYPQYFSSNNQP
ncbi:MAG: Stf0 family sulfotransferase [Cytophagales bacterium]|nr:Stf0 family sulfotransferase [Cytophagales bacterium]